MRPLLLLPLVLAAACSRSEPPASGNTFLWGRSADASYLDPAIVSDGESVMVTTNIFDTLVTFEPGGTKIVPCLAERWERSEDGTQWTFHLREGVRFHDRTPVNAAAVVFSFERQSDPDHPAHKGTFSFYQDYFPVLEKVEAVDARTVRFTLRRPHAPFLDTLALFSSAIVSPSAWKSEGIGPDGKYRYDFASHPVGSGPFVFREWKRDERIVLEANDDYFLGRPAIDRLIFRPVKDPRARLKDLQAGGLHGMDNPDLVDLGRARKDERLRVVERPGFNVCYLAMNTMKAPFDDARVCRAVSLAIDKRRLIASAYNGVGRPAPTMLPAGMLGHLPLQETGPDPARAKALLAEAGFPDGFETEIWHGDAQRTYMPDPDAVAIQVQQDLKAIGIRARVKKMEWSAYIPATQRGEHPMCLLGWMADIGDPDGFLSVLLHKDNARVGSANNISFYRGEAVSRLLTQAQATYDVAERVRLYQEAQRILAEEAPTVPLVTVPDLRVLRREVRGYVLYPVGGEYFRTVSFAK